MGLQLTFTECQTQKLKIKIIIRQTGKRAKYVVGVGATRILFRLAGSVLVFYGGLIGGIAAGLIAIKSMRLNSGIYADTMAPVIPLFHGFARIGCFFAGCCYGVQSDIGFTAHGNQFVAEVNDVCRFPVQLLEAACNFALLSVDRGHLPYVIAEHGADGVTADYSGGDTVVIELAYFLNT